MDLNAPAYQLALSRQDDRLVLENVRIEIAGNGTMTVEPYERPATLPVRGGATGLVIGLISPSGAGVSTLVERLEARYPGRVEHVTRYTTRRERADDSGEYVYLAPEEFARRRAAGDLIRVTDTYGSLRGVSRAEINAALSDGKLLLYPMSQHDPDFDAELDDRVAYVYVSPVAAIQRQDAAAVRRVLERRQAARGTTRPEELEQRLARGVEILATIPADAVVIENLDGHQDAAVQQLQAQLQRLAPELGPPTTAGGSSSGLEKKALPQTSQERDSAVLPVEGGADLEQELVNFLAQQDPLPAKADLLVLFGNNDLRTIERAAELYREARVNRLLVSGGHGRLTQSLKDHLRLDARYRSVLSGRERSEADMIAALLEYLG
ncbi:MAG: hypothetical protein Q8S13_07225, partial [Dehalococcoidia bacterium]|nr:hypothetical protein [Dehalococcoidia bacterium]